MCYERVETLGLLGVYSWEKFLTETCIGRAVTLHRPFHTLYEIYLQDYTVLNLYATYNHSIVQGIQ